MAARQVVGIDGWRGGWIAVALEESGTRAAAESDLAALVARFPDAAVVAIDMPIGFPTAEPRRADIAAQAFVGPRRSSVFLTLPEAAYAAPTHREAVEVCRRLWGKGVSQQAYALRTKVFEVAELRSRDGRVAEVHPEVSFTAMAGEPPAWAKRTWNGQRLRARLLAGAGVRLPGDLGPAGLAPVDDVLDAAVCAWSAARIRDGRAGTLPGDPAEGEPVIHY